MTSVLNCASFLGHMSVDGQPQDPSERAVNSQYSTLLTAVLATDTAVQPMMNAKPNESPLHLSSSAAAAPVTEHAAALAAIKVFRPGFDACAPPRHRLRRHRVQAMAANEDNEDENQRPLP